MKDLFDEVALRVGCEYVSDMRFSPYNQRAKAALKEIDYTRYSLQNLADIYGYLYGKEVTFADYEQAKAAIEG